MATKPLVVLCVVVVLAAAWVPAYAQAPEVTPTVETQPVPNDGDAADDPAIWIHPSDPSQSTVIGTDKEGGLAVYDLRGRQIQYVSGMRPNNVDVRHNVLLGGRTVDLVVASDRSDDALVVFSVNPETRWLTEAALVAIPTEVDVYGLCMYRSPHTGDVYVFVTPEEDGEVQQWRLTDAGSGRVGGELVRRFPAHTTSEGCVADDELALLYVAEEGEAIWKYEAEPDRGSDRVAVDAVGSRLEADIEGLTIYYGPEGRGYLIASSQGSSEFVVYRREGSNEYVTRFQIADGRIDGVSNTDGIDVVGIPLGSAFPTGFFVAQDGDNDPANQNFKLVPWHVIARVARPELMIHTDWNPRGEGIRRPLPRDPVSSGRVGVGNVVSGPWVAVEAQLAGGREDGEAGPEGVITDNAVLRMESGREVILRFDQVDVPAGALIRNAFVQFGAAEADGAPVVLGIEAFLTGRGPAPPASVGDLPRTSAVTWAPAPWSTAGAHGPYQRTPDLSAILREIVAHPDWTAGGSVTVVIGGEGGGARIATAYDAEPDRAPVLRLEFAAAR